MIFCENCFQDAEVISIIRRQNFKGKCPICGKNNVYLYDTNNNYDLVSLFDDLISIFTPVSLLPTEYPKSEIKLLKTELKENWHIFGDIGESNIYKILIGICSDRYENNPELFDYPIGIAELYRNEKFESNLLLKSNTWEEFTESLKTTNRFHSHYINLELLKKFCTFIRKPYKTGELFYRCRIGDSDGFDIYSMFAPDSSKTVNGRANSKGIRCLYLADDIETTIHETRAGEYDYVTIGTFRLKKNIIVVDLKRINRISPFIEGLDAKEYALNKETLNKINFELGKTLRRSDSDLDYLPTQYISDFIKSIKHNNVNEYSGIEYNSVMYEKGYNLAIFDPELFECINTEVYRIENVTYHIHQIR